MNQHTQTANRIGLRRSRPAEAGFGLIELMVSLVIGLIILGAMVTLFVKSSGNNREMQRANAVIENGRATVEVVQSDLVHAGYWGPVVPEYDDQTFEDDPTDVPAAVPDPCAAFAPANWTADYLRAMIAIPVQSYSSDSTICGTVIDYAHIVPDTDVLVVRHAETCLPGEVIGAGNCEAEDTSKVYVQTSLCGDDTARFIIGTTGFDLHKRNCIDPADKRKFTSSIYWLRDYAVTDGDGIPTLMRAQFDLDSLGTPAFGDSVPLVQNVERFMVELGIDSLSKTGDAIDYSVPIDWDDPDTHTTPTNRGDGAPDGAFVRCGDTGCTLAQLMNVTAVNLYVLVRSPEESRNYTDSKDYTLASGVTAGPFDDHYKRHLFTHMVRLPNMSNRRMTP